MPSDATYDDTLQRMIDAALDSGARTLHDVLVRCEGADPRRVAARFGDRQPNEPLPRGSAPLQATVFGGGVPAPDPLACQWWFTVETVERLATLAYREAGPAPQPRLLAVGAPTVALQFSRFYGHAVAVDSDPDLGRTLDGPPALTFVRANVFDGGVQLPDESYDVAIADPPWYVDETLAFLYFGLRAVRVGGSVLCSLPPRMTRPSVVSERQELLRTLQNASVEIVSLTPQVTEYYVPPFEFQAYRDLSGFDGRPWRRGDLLHVRKIGEVQQPKTPNRSTLITRAYSRTPTDFRVFVRATNANTAQAIPTVRRELAFERTVSRREFDPAQLDWWTSERVGGYVDDSLSLECALRTGIARKKWTPELRG